MLAKTQQDLVNQKIVEERVEVGDVSTNVRVTVPGIQTLHLESAEEIAIVLTNVLRSAPNITELKWKIGEYIELTSEPVL